MKRICWCHVNSTVPPLQCSCAARWSETLPAPTSCRHFAAAGPTIAMVAAWRHMLPGKISMIAGEGVFWCFLTGNLKTKSNRTTPSAAKSSAKLKRAWVQLTVGLPLKLYDFPTRILTNDAQKLVSKHLPPARKFPRCLDLANLMLTMPKNPQHGLLDHIRECCNKK